MVKNFERLLQKLEVIPWYYSFIPTDWPDHEDYYWQCYSKNVKEKEDAKAKVNQTS